MGMAKKEQDGCSALVAVAIIAFLLGRCSVGDQQDTAPRASVPAALTAEPFSSNDNVGRQADAAPEADIDTAVEAEAPPVRFVSPAPNRIVGTSFRNCSEARAAGAAPVMADDPGYAPRLDRDGDGVGCE
jgi:hypothetical protein